MDRVYSLDDFDWSDSEPPAASPATPPRVEPESVAPAPRRRQADDPYGDLDPSLLPPAYRDAIGSKNVYKRRSVSPKTYSMDDFDWGGDEATPLRSSGYNPDDDWAITRGIKAGYEGGVDAMSGAAEMARIMTLPTDQQAAAMLEVANQPAEPGAARLTVPGVENIGGVGDFATWLGENAGNLLGSWGAAAFYGGGTGAAAGAAIGGTAGAAGLGVGAVPGAVGGAVAGFGYGTFTGFGTIGVGGMFRDLLADEGVKAGLRDGTVTPDTIKSWSILGGAAIGALDAFPAAKFLKSGSKVGKEAVVATIKQAILKGAGRQMLEEGGTEAMQGAVSELGQALVGGDVELANRALSVINQGLAGAIGGAGPGAAYGAYEYKPKAAGTAGDAGPAGSASPLRSPADPGGSGPNDGNGSRPKAPVGSTVTPIGPDSYAIDYGPEIVPKGEVSSELRAATTATSSRRRAEGGGGAAKTPPAAPPAQPEGLEVEEEEEIGPDEEDIEEDIEGDVLLPDEGQPVPRDYGKETREPPIHLTPNRQLIFDDVMGEAERRGLTNVEPLVQRFLATAPRNVSGVRLREQALQLLGHATEQQAGDPAIAAAVKSRRKREPGVQQQPSAAPTQVTTPPAAGTPKQPAVVPPIQQQPAAPVEAAGSPGVTQPVTLEPTPVPVAEQRVPRPQRGPVAAAPTPAPADEAEAVTPPTEAEAEREPVAARRPFEEYLQLHRGQATPRLKQWLDAGSQAEEHPGDGNWDRFRLSPEERQAIEQVIAERSGRRIPRARQPEPAPAEQALPEPEPLKGRKALEARRVSLQNFARNLPAVTLAEGVTRRVRRETVTETTPEGVPVTRETATTAEIPSGEGMHVINVTSLNDALRVYKSLSKSPRLQKDFFDALHPALQDALQDRLTGTRTSGAPKEPTGGQKRPPLPRKATEPPSLPAKAVGLPKRFQPEEEAKPTVKPAVEERRRETFTPEQFAATLKLQGETYLHGLLAGAEVIHRKTKKRIGVIKDVTGSTITVLQKLTRSNWADIADMMGAKFKPALVGKRVGDTMITDVMGVGKKARLSGFADTGKAFADNDVSINVPWPAAKLLAVHDVERTARTPAKIVKPPIKEPTKVTGFDAILQRIGQHFETSIQPVRLKDLGTLDDSYDWIDTLEERGLADYRGAMTKEQYQRLKASRAGVAAPKVTPSGERKTSAEVERHEAKAGDVWTIVQLTPTKSGELSKYIYKQRRMAQPEAPTPAEKTTIVKHPKAERAKKRGLSKESREFYGEVERPSPAGSAATIEGVGRVSGTSGVKQGKAARQFKRISKVAEQEETLAYRAAQAFEEKVTTQRRSLELRSEQIGSNIRQLLGSTAMPTRLPFEKDPNTRIAEAEALAMRDQEKGKPLTPTETKAAVVVAKAVAAELGIPVTDKLFTEYHFAAEKIRAAIDHSIMLFHRLVSAGTSEQEARRAAEKKLFDEEMEPIYASLAATSVKTKRKGKKSGMPAAKMEAQDDGELRRQANDETKKANPDPWLVEIDKAFKAAARYRKAGNKDAALLEEVKYEQLQKQRIAERRKQEGLEEKHEAAERTAAEIADRELQQHISYMIEVGALDPDHAEAITADFRRGQRHRKMHERASKTLPLIRGVLAEHQLPSKLPHIGKRKKIKGVVLDPLYDLALDLARKGQKAEEIEAEVKRSYPETSAKLSDGEFANLVKRQLAVALQHGPVYQFRSKKQARRAAGMSDREALAAEQAIRDLRFAEPSLQERRKQRRKTGGNLETVSYEIDPETGFEKPVYETVEASDIEAIPTGVTTISKRRLTEIVDAITQGLDDLETARHDEFKANQEKGRVAKSAEYEPLYVLPKRVNSETNMPEENAIIFAKRVLTTGIHGYTLSDAWQAIQYAYRVQPVQKKGESDKAFGKRQADAWWRGKQMDAELYGLVTEAVNTESAGGGPAYQAPSKSSAALQEKMSEEARDAMEQAERVRTETAEAEALEEGTTISLEQAAAEGAYVSDDTLEKLAEAWGAKLTRGRNVFSVPTGWEIADTMDRMTPEQQAEAARIVEELTGIKPTFEESIEGGPRAAKMWGEDIAQAGGVYDTIARTIALHVYSSSNRTAYHEAFHDLQNYFATRAERVVMKLEHQRLRDMVAKVPGRARQVASMDQIEIEAEAFASYSMGLANPPPMIRRLWNKMLRFIRRVNNWWSGGQFLTSEDVFERALSGEMKGRVPLEHPQLMGSLYSIPAFDALAKGARRLVSEDNRKRGRYVRMHLTNTTEEIRKYAADTFFGGSFNNPASDLANELLEHTREVDDLMQEGGKLNSDLLRWMQVDPAARETIVDEAHDLIVNASLDDIDPRRDLKDSPWIRHDAFHPTKRKRKGPTWAHSRDTGKRAAHMRYQERWDALPDDLKPILSKRLDQFKKSMDRYERRIIRNWLRMLQEKEPHAVTLPKGMSEDMAVDQIINRKMSDELKAALGDNLDTMVQVGRFAMRGGVYAPAFRTGDHFITARRDIALPAAKHGKVALDKKALKDKDVYRFVFTSEQDMSNYLLKIGMDGEERPIGKPQRIMINPVTKTRVRPGEVPRDAEGNRIKLVPNYIVTMQHRHMAMSDSIEELTKIAKELRDEGYTEVSTPALLAEARGNVHNLPRSLGAINHQIDSMVGIDDREKALMKSALTHAYIASQQGNRLSKRLLRRTGVGGFETNAENMFLSFHQADDMLARHTVSLDRLPAIRKADKRLSQYSDILRAGDPAARKKALAAMPKKEADRLTLDYGKRQEVAAVMLGEVQKELNDRLNSSMTARGKPFGQKLMNFGLSTVTLSYLFGPAYIIMQALGLPMQTFPSMAAEFARADGAFGGIGRASQYMGKAFNDVSGFKNYWRSMTEAMEEGKHLIRGFAPRKDYLKYSRGTRRPFDYVKELVDHIAGTKYGSAKQEALKRMRVRGHIGRTGIDQPNFKMGYLEGGVGNKFVRGMEQMMNVFRSLQEGFEINNRAVPVLAYVEYFMDKGMDEEQAIEKAINRTVSEQVGYTKENWPNWFSRPAAMGALMFKKFAIQQASNYYGALAKTFHPETSAVDRREAMVRVGLMTAMLVGLGGASGLPMWEIFRLVLYLGKALGLVDDVDWTTRSKQGEEWMASLVGPTAAENVMYGLPRLAGVDLSNRIAMDNLLFYQQPTEMSQDAWWKVLGQMYGGAPVSLGFQTLSTMSDLQGTKSWPKWLQGLPLPKTTKDIMKAYDLATSGSTTTTGVRTGEPTGLMDSVITSLGLQTRTEARKFEVGSYAQHKEQTQIDDARKALIGRIVNQGMTGGNMAALRRWNADHKGDDRIKMSSITRAKRNRRKTEKEIRQQNVEAY